MTAVMDEQCLPLRKPSRGKDIGVGDNSTLDLGAPVIYQPCFRGNVITQGQLYMPLLTKVEDVISQGENTAKLRGIRQRFMAGISGSMVQNAGVNRVVQHLWLNAWELGNGECITGQNLRFALGDLYSLGHFMEPGEGEALLRVEENIHLFFELTEVLEAVLIPSPKQWSKFQEKCLSAGRGSLRMGARAAAIPFLNEAVKAELLPSPSERDVNTVVEILGRFMEQHVSFAPRGYISGEEILALLSLVQEYNGEWAEAAMELMRGAL